jgi:ABC-type bacteriocin/lantibiotic exporter with double-glycine peptidase domain
MNSLLFTYISLVVIIVYSKELLLVNDTLVIIGVCAIVFYFIVSYASGKTTNHIDTKASEVKDEASIFFREFENVLEDLENLEKSYVESLNTYVKFLGEYSDCLFNKNLYQFQYTNIITFPV